MEDPNSKKHPLDTRNWFNSGEDGAQAAEAVTIMGPNNQPIDFSSIFDGLGGSNGSGDDETPEDLLNALETLKSNVIDSINALRLENTSEIKSSSDSIVEAIGSIDVSSGGSVSLPSGENRSIKIIAANTSQELLPVTPGRVYAIFIANDKIWARESSDGSPAVIEGVGSLEIETGHQVLVSTDSAVQVIADKANVVIYCIEGVQ